MSKKYNIDELLSESFENFSPEAPDVWQGVQQGIQAAQASSSAGSAMVAAKGSALVIKIIAAVAVVSAVVAGYVLYTPTDTDSTTALVPKKEAQVVAPSEIPVDESKSLAVETVSPLSPPEPIKQSVLSKEPVVADPVGKNIPAQVVELSTSQAEEAKAQIILPKQTNTEVVVEHKPTTTQPKPTVTEKTQKQPTPESMTAPERNPNPEEVVFEEPTIPGSFSPDGDGVNDVFKVLIDKEQFFLLTIYDKEGKTVFVSNNKENTWDGKDYRNGNPCLPGTYSWVFRYQFKDAENESSKRGILKLF